MVKGLKIIAEPITTLSQLNLSISRKNAEKTGRWPVKKGTFMKQKKLPTLVALSISLEMMLAPLPVLAQEKAANIYDNITKGLNLANQVYSTATGAANQRSAQ